jgi:hypothetical protein
MKKVLVIAVALMLAIMMFGCGGKSGSGFMSDARMFTLGDSTANEFPTRSTLIGDRLTMIVRYGTLDGLESPREGLWLEMHELDGTEVWALPLESNMEVGEMIEGENGTGMMVVRLLTDDGMPAGTEIWTFDGKTGTIISHIPIPWDNDYSAWSIYQLPDNQFLVLGAKMWGRGATVFISHGVVINADGSKHADWPVDVTNLFPVEDGFIGVMRMPGGRKSDAELMRINYDGEVVWHNERADTLIDGIVMGVVQVEGGDILLTAQDRVGVQPIIARLGYDDGSARWVKRPEELFRTTCYNPLPWNDGLWFVGISEMVFRDGKSWNETGAVTITSDGEIIDRTQPDDIWMIPTLIQVDVGAGKAVMVGIGHQNKGSFPKLSDVAWLTTGIAG